MLVRASQFIHKHGLLPPGSRVLVGVSGGMDSAAMFHLLSLLREQLSFELQAAHFNHGIRPEAGEDEQFVREMCLHLGVKLHVGRADVPALAREQGVSVEVAAREARHAFFRETMAVQACNLLALAHHSDDQAETVLLRLIRGTGAAGLRAMAPREPNGIIRPLLGVSRAEIHAYCEQNGIAWREDATNADCTIPRNYVRHEILPRLAVLNPQAPEALCRAAELLRADEEYLSAEAEKVLAQACTRADGSMAIPVLSLLGLHPAVLSRALRLLMARAGRELDVEEVNIADALKLLENGSTGKRVDMGGGYAVIREAAELAVYPMLPQAEPFAPVPLAIPGKTVTPLGTFVCELLEGIPTDYRHPPEFTRYMDYAALPQGMVIRGRQPGDRFHPLNAPGGRKLKEYLIDAKTARYRRDSLPLLAYGQDVLWPVGFTIADGVKITDKTQRVLKITTITGEDDL